MIQEPLWTKAMKILELLFKHHLMSTLFVGIITTGILLFIPSNLLGYLGLEEFACSCKGYLGITFLAGTICLIVIGLPRFINWWKRKRMFKGQDARYRIEQTSDWGKSLIRQLYESPSRSLKLPLQDANVTLMIHTQILTNSQLGDRIGFDCILQPWVVEFLDQNPKDLAKLPKFAKPYKIPSIFD